MNTSENKIISLRLWEESEYLKLGEFLCKLIPVSAQPSWFVNLLSIVLHDKERVGPIDSLIKITQDESRWHESSEVFDSLRKQTLICEQSDSDNYRKIGILHLAENIAKVTFNSSNSEQAKFDFDAGYWVPQCVKYIIDHSEDEKLNSTLIEYLISPEF